MQHQISGIDRVRIAAQALVCERTVRRVYFGQGTPHSRARVRRAALELGLPLPEQGQQAPTQPV